MPYKNELEEFRRINARRMELGLDRRAVTNRGPDPVQRSYERREERDRDQSPS